MTSYVPRCWRWPAGDIISFVLQVICLKAHKHCNQRYIPRCTHDRLGIFCLRCHPLTLAKEREEEYEVAAPVKDGAKITPNRSN